MIQLGDKTTHGATLVTINAGEYIVSTDGGNCGHSVIHAADRLRSIPPDFASFPSGKMSDAFPFSL
ncbi:MAG: hypothetical protein EPN73_02405 [Paraburkholderia sp.]|uniref:hypothetical protein n=1 Tax=Paraburkholderia sp. TaxID=1926495 RepID=UPI001205516E|nr:hypothetical protein [Paraburkholderia sp.]TAL98781.1 MAG: hypothetical protein EPN73_02405 [Paraburkholderia sp.]